MSLLEDKLAKAVKSLCLAQPFYGLFMMMVNKSWDSKIPSMGVAKDKINYFLKINPEFFTALTDHWRVGLIQHEMLHIAFFHMEAYDRYKERNILNIAMDMEINQYIDGKYLPGFELSKEEFKEKYDPIKEELDNQFANGSITKEEYKQAMMAKIPPRGVYIKDFSELHLDYKAGTDYYYHKLLEAKDKKPGEDGYSDTLNDFLNDFPEGLNHDWEEFENMSEAEKHLMRKQVDTLMKEVAEHIKKSRGTVPGEMSGYIDSLYLNEPPKFNWKAYLRRFVGGSKKVYTKKLHRKYNKRFEDNPGLKIKQQRRIMVAVDTSGSVSREELVEFFQEMHHMTKLGTEVVVVQADSEVQNISDFKDFYKSIKEEGKAKIYGRGGTSFTPAVDYYNQHKSEFSCLVYLTDGEAPVPENKPQGPMLWVLSSKSVHCNHLYPKIKLN